MEQRVKVISCYPNGTAQVAYLRQSACSGDCHKCSGCGAVQQTMVVTAQNPINARPGDLVTIESRSGPVLQAATVLYLLPLVLFVAGYLVGMQWQLGGFMGVAAFGLGIALAVCYDRLVMKRKNAHYTIVRFEKE